MIISNSLIIGVMDTKNAICSGMRQAIGIRSVLGICGMMLTVYWASAETLLRLFPLTSSLPFGYHTDFVIMALQSDSLVPFIPIIAVLPFSASYVDDIKSKFARYFCARSSYNIYIISRIIACFLCGGIVIVSGILLAWGIAALLFMPLEQVETTQSDALATLLTLCWMMFWAGGFWSVMGMAMSSLMESKYIAYATPFVLYYLLVILYERYFSDLFILYPKTWTDPTVWPFGCWGATIFLLEMTLIFAFLFAYRAGRRLQQL